MQSISEPESFSLKVHVCFTARCHSTDSDLREQSFLEEWFSFLKTDVSNDSAHRREFWVECYRGDGPVLINLLCLKVEMAKHFFPLETQCWWTAGVFREPPEWREMYRMPNLWIVPRWDLAHGPTCYITCHLADAFIQSDLQLIRLSRRHTPWSNVGLRALLKGLTPNCSWRAGWYLAWQPIAVGVWMCVWTGEWEASIVQRFE